MNRQLLVTDTGIRTSTGKDAPESRTVQELQAGRIIQIREVGGLHHRYERRAA
jgi:hypothetical protein